MLREFKENYTFAGNPPVETVIKNLDYIRKNLSPETKLVLILGSEVPTTKVQAGYENMAERHKIMNQSVRKWCAANILSSRMKIIQPVLTIFQEKFMQILPEKSKTS